MNFKDLLHEHRACSEAVEWAANMPIEEVVRTCHRGDWLLWLAKKIDIPIKPLTLAKARCAKTVIHLMRDQRSIDAVNIAEKFGLTDEVTEDELRTAAASAYAAAAAYAAASADYASAYAAAAAAAAYASAYADYASAYAAAAAAAAAASADAAADASADAAADAAAADAAAADASAAAAAASAYAAADAAAADNARKENQKQTADICREILGDLIIKKVNKILTT